MDRDERPSAAALRPVDDQIIGRQTGQGPPDGLEVVTTATGRRDALDHLGKPDPVVGDPAPAAQQREHRGQHLAARAAKLQPARMCFHAFTHQRGI